MSCLGKKESAYGAVKTGRMTHSFVEITEGLEVDEIVALDAYQRGTADFADTERNDDAATGEESSEDANEESTPATVPTAPVAGGPTAAGEGELPGFGHFAAMLQMAIRGVMMHKLRSMLTVLGLVFGVASVIVMLAVAEGASQQAQRQIAALGVNNIIVRSVKPTSTDQEINYNSFDAEFRLDL